MTLHHNNSENNVAPDLDVGGGGGGAKTWIHWALALIKLTRIVGEFMDDCYYLFASVVLVVYMKLQLLSVTIHLFHATKTVCSVILTPCLQWLYQTPITTIYTLLQETCIVST